MPLKVGKCHPDWITGIVHHNTYSHLSYIKFWSSFFSFCAERQTDTRTPPKTIPASLSVAGAPVINYRQVRPPTSAKAVAGNCLREAVIDYTLLMLALLGCPPEPLHPSTTIACDWKMLNKNQVARKHHRDNDVLLSHAMLHAMLHDDWRIT